MYIFHAAAMLLFYFPKKITFTKTAYSYNILYKLLRSLCYFREIETYDVLDGLQ
jgi:hypothetical protein